MRPCPAPPPFPFPYPSSVICSSTGIPDSRTCWIRLSRCLRLGCGANGNSSSARRRMPRSRRISVSAWRPVVSIEPRACRTSRCSPSSRRWAACAFAVDGDLAGSFQDEVDLLLQVPVLAQRLGGGYLSDAHGERLAMGEISADEGFPVNQTLL